MTERTLLLRCASAGRYFIVGTDFPSARVFDTTTSTLACVVDLPVRSRTSLSTLSLTSVALGSIAGGQHHSNKSARASITLVDDAIEMTYAAVGLSNGTLLLHSVTRDEPVGHVAVSETQHAIISMAFCGPFLFCLDSSCTVSVLDVERSAMGVQLRIRAQPDASAVAVVAMVDQSQGKATDAALRSFRVMVAGPTNAVYLAHLTRSSAASASKDTHQHTSQGNVVEKELSFASQGSAVDFVWLSASAGHVTADTAAASTPVAAITSNAQEGVIHVWDVRPTTVSSATLSRCRRTLLCGQRVANLSVLEGSSGGDGNGAYVMATTFTGAVLLWELGEVFAPRVVEPVPLAPTIALASSASIGRLLYGALRPPKAGAGSGVEGLGVLLLRGRFALPHFDSTTVGELLQHPQSQAYTRKQRRATAAMMALGFGDGVSSSGGSSLKIVEVPLSSAYQEELERQRVVLGVADGHRMGDGAAASFTVVDTNWATHQDRVASKALVTATESFAAARTHQAASTKDLPVRQVTLEQRLRDLEKTVMTRTMAAASEAATQDGTATQFQHTTALATVPLYQALHANDTSAVMELLTLVGRSRENVRATIMSLQLPYCLQLLHVLSQRLGISSGKSSKGVHSAEATVVSGGGVAAISCRSPLLEWFDAIVQYRGMELYTAQCSAGEESGDGTTAAAAEAVSSPPKDFIAPVLHQYRGLCSQYDKLASLYGRMSVFNAVRPSEKNSFVNRRRKVLSSNIEAGRTPASISGKDDLGILQDDILFPVMFTECRSREGPHVIRVRSRLAIEKKRRKQVASDRALLRRAKQMAKGAAGAKKSSGGILDDNDSDAMDEAMIEKMAQNGGEIDFDELEQMDINDSDAADIDDGDDEEEELSTSDSEEDDEDDAALKAPSKKVRRETDELFADATAVSDEDNDDDADAQLDSSEAEFSSGSDIDDRSDVLEFSDDDESSEEDEGDRDEAAGRPSSDDEDSDNDNDSMQELLAKSTDENDRAERRKAKRVRTD